jgi:hypothetical protein
MKFWDASAIVPLLVLETQTRQLQSMAAKDSAMLQRYGFFVFTHCVLPMHCNWRRLSQPRSVGSMTALPMQHAGRDLQ